MTEHLRIGHISWHHVLDALLDILRLPLDTALDQVFALGFLLSSTICFLLSADVHLLLLELLLLRLMAQSNRIHQRLLLLLAAVHHKLLNGIASRCAGSVVVG